ncbi:hypothetical protein B0H19DRAFT_1239005, partial [Mycena capillaripes]
MKSSNDHKVSTKASNEHNKSEYRMQCRTGTSADSSCTLTRYILSKVLQMVYDGFFPCSTVSRAVLSSSFLLARLGPHDFLRPTYDHFQRNVHHLHPRRFTYRCAYALQCHPWGGVYTYSDDHGLPMLYRVTPCCYGRYNDRGCRPIEGLAQNRTPVIQRSEPCFQCLECRWRPPQQPHRQTSQTALDNLGKQFTSVWPHRRSSASLSVRRHPEPDPTAHNCAKLAQRALDLVAPPFEPVWYASADATSQRCLAGLTDLAQQLPRQVL